MLKLKKCIEYIKGSYDYNELSLLLELIRIHLVNIEAISLGDKISDTVRVNTKKRESQHTEDYCGRG